MKAGQYVVQAANVSNQDPHGAAKHLGWHASDIYDEILDFQERNQEALPSTAAQALNKFTTRRKDIFKGSLSNRFEEMRIRLALLASIGAELDYHLSDFTVVTLRKVRRAFLHLQRCIIADETLGERWRDAFNKNEPACEKLGGAHLLLDGVWAFKVTDPSERTDLVFGGEIRDTGEVHGAADALVLTEWKLVRDTDDPLQKLDEARTQASLYAQGVLGGVELVNHRFLVLVSRDRIDMPSDQRTGDVDYHNVNIAVSPSTPSKTARKKGSRVRQSM